MYNRAAFLILVLVTALNSSVLADQWDAQFGWAQPFPPGYNFNGAVNDVLVVNNDIYVCGEFTAMGSTPVSRLAHWNGSSWANIGPTLTTNDWQGIHINNLARHQQWIVAAGNFASVNGQPGNIALWDGQAWSALTMGPADGNFYVTSLMSDDTYLYVGGFLGYVGRWDGTTTESLSAWSQSWIYSMLSWNGSLYVGGAFQYFNGSNKYNVARWDGSWYSMAGGIPSSIVHSVLLHDNTLYAVGTGQAWSWTGSAWVMPLPQLTRCESSTAGEGLFVGGRLYMGGPTGAYNSLAVSNGAVWETMSGGLSPALCNGPQLAEYQGRTLVAGQFTTAGGLSAPGMALWNDTSWYTRGPDRDVTAIAASASDVYVLGWFEKVMDTPLHRAARWDGNTWHPLGTGIDGTVNAALVVGTDLYVGGQFTDAGESGAVNLAKWDGVSWSPVGPPLNGPVHALATDGTDIYVGGDFATFQGEYLERIARWDGSAFHALGQGVRDGTVRAILVDGTRVYAGGDFTMTGSYLPTGNAAYFDGNWHTLDNGFYDGTVRDLELHSGTLFAAGSFTVGGSLNRIAAWSGTSWVGLPELGSPALNGDAYAMLSSGGSLYVTGDFTTAGGNPANHIARWYGLKWYSLGAGLNARAEALAAGPGGIYAGGLFGTAGGQASQRIARWMQVVSGVEPGIPARTSLESVFPNPFNPSTSIRYHVGASARVTLAIYDVRGRLVRQLLDEDIPGSAQERTITWDGSDDRGRPVASGVYFVRMHTPSSAQSRKMVLIK